MSLPPPVLDWMDVKFAVAIDFGRRRDPLAPAWIHFHSIEGRDKHADNKNGGTRDFEDVHILHESLGFGSLVTCSFSEYLYLIHVIQLPVIYVEEKFLPMILSKEVYNSLTSSSTTTTGTTTTGTDAATQQSSSSPLLPPPPPSPANHKWIIRKDDDLISNWITEPAPNAYYRSYRLARQIEHLKNHHAAHAATSISMFEMNNSSSSSSNDDDDDENKKNGGGGDDDDDDDDDKKDKHYEEIVKMFQNLQFKMSVINK